MIRQRFQTTEGIAAIKQTIEVVIRDELPDITKLRSENQGHIRQINQTIHNLIDSLTPTNRDFVDQRLLELKRELTSLEKKRVEIEQIDAKKIDTVKLIEQSVEMARQFMVVFEQGTIEEKRLFIRSFVGKIEIDPLTGNISANFILMPGLDQAKWQAQE